MIFYYSLVALFFLKACASALSATEQTNLHTPHPHNPTTTTTTQQTLKIFVIAGQSNAEGHAEVATKNKTTGAFLNGTLAYQLSDPRTAALFAPLWDKNLNNWTVLDNVKIWYNEIGSESGINGSNIPSKPGEAAMGNLTIGFGALAHPDLIGPELGFGFGFDETFNGEKILIMKTAWGGKDLAQDFRPPSSVSNFDVYCQEAPCVNQVGHYYQVMISDIHKMLSPGAVAAMYPDLAGLNPVLAGIG
jgi:alpha-galactosidase